MKFNLLVLGICLLGGAAARNEEQGKVLIAERAPLKLPQMHHPAANPGKKAHHTIVPHKTQAHHSAPAQHTANSHKTKGVASHSKHASATHSDKAIHTSHHSGTHTKSASHTTSHTSSAAHGPTTNMVIFGRKKISDAKFKAAIKDIKHKVTLLKQNTKLSLQMAAAPLTQKEIAELKKNPAIAGVEQDTQVDTEGKKPPTKGKGNTPGKSPITKPSTGKKGKGGKRSTELLKRGFFVQDNVMDLAMLSTEKGYENDGDYFYDESAGEGINIYVLDTGLNPKHPEFSEVKSIRWLFPVPDSTTQAEDDPDGHGTCVASKAVGKRYGVAKDANLVIVKNAVKCTYSELIDEWAVMYEDALARQMGQKCVINYSAAIFSWPSTVVFDAYKEVLHQLLDTGCIIVTSSGNDHKAVNGYPALLAHEMPIIVVGAVDTKGKRLAFSNTGSQVLVAAAGQVVCPYKRGKSKVRRVAGTSFAAPQVAGLVAYFLAHPNTKEHFAAIEGEARSVEMIKLIKMLAYPRSPGGPPVAFNGIGDSMACRLKGSECPGWVKGLEDPGIIESMTPISTLATKVKGKTPKTHEASATKEAATATHKAVTTHEARGKKETPTKEAKASTSCFYEDDDWTCGMWKRAEATPSA